MLPFQSQHINPTSQKVAHLSWICPECILILFCLFALKAKSGKRFFFFLVFFVSLKSCIILPSTMQLNITGNWRVQNALKQI